MKKIVIFPAGPSALPFFLTRYRKILDCFHSFLTVILCANCCHRLKIYKDFKEAGITQKKIDMLPRGAILGTVTLTDCFVIDEAYRNYIRENYPDEYAFGDYSIGRYVWTFEEPMEYCLPVPASGRSCPGLWNW